MAGEFDDIRGRLEGISEELADLAIERLKESIDAGGTELPVDERRLQRARRAVEKAIGILREAEGTSVKAVCARQNISAATYDGWKAKFGGMDVNEARRLRALEDENRRLKNLVADQAVQISILKEVNSKKW